MRSVPVRISVAVRLVLALSTPAALMPNPLIAAPRVDDAASVWLSMRA